MLPFLEQAYQPVLKNSIKEFEMASEAGQSSSQTVPRTADKSSTIAGIKHHLSDSESDEVEIIHVETVSAACGIPPGEGVVPPPSQPGASSIPKLSLLVYGNINVCASME